MATALNAFFASLGFKPGRSPRRQQPRAERRLSAFESLEPRKLMAHLAVLNFDGGTFTPAEMARGHWTAHEDGTPFTANTTVSSFKDLFNNTHPGLDINHDGNVNTADANLAVDAILSKVREIYSPYDLNISLGGKTSLPWSQGGDVLVMVTGGTDTITGVANSAGVTAGADVGNEHDDLCWVFGGVLADNLEADQFITNTAQVISHEMGHAFGLKHIQFDQFLPNGQLNSAPTRNIMSNSFGFSRYFQDVSFTTRVEAGESVLHPELNTTTQNSHQYLSNPFVLGPSKNGWVAVLKPGQVTISGNDYDNNIAVRPFTTNQWLITNASSYVLSSTKTVSFTTETLLAVSNPSSIGHDRNSLNPFNTPLDTIVVNAKGGNDIVSLKSSILATSLVSGGEGNDTIYGGIGINVLNGDGGRDKLYGADSRDFLFGGLDADELFGYGDSDTLDGGDDMAVDILHGGTGQDTYIQYINLFGFFTRKDTVDDAGLDSLVTIKRSRFV